MNQRKITWFLASAMAVSSVPFVGGCESLPGNEKQQGAVIGGLGGAAAGAMIGGKDNRLLGALIGGAAGAGGGYLVGANWDKIRGKHGGDHDDDARVAADRAEREPARASDVRNSSTADLNSDGFVTLDEIVAMHDANLSSDEMIRRLKRTDQYFELTREQENFLRDKGVDDDVIVAMRDLNRDSSARLTSERGDRSDRTDRTDRRDRDVR
jgi:hypothetical protein